MMAIIIKKNIIKIEINENKPNILIIITKLIFMIECDDKKN